MPEKKLHLVFQVLNFLHSNESSQYNLTDDEKLLLINLASHHGPRGIFPSIPTIAKERKRDDRNIRRTLDRLIQKELISKTDFLGKSNQYSIHLTPGVHAIPPLEMTPGVDATPPLAWAPETPGVGAPLYNKEELINSKALKAMVVNDPIALNRFDEFWTVYPRKENKKKAKEIWQRKKLDAKADFIIADVLARTERHQPWQAGYIPHATTYLNGERWDDSLTETANGKNGHDLRTNKLERPKSNNEASWDYLAKAAGYREGSESFVILENDLSNEISSPLPQRRITNGSGSAMD